MPKESKKVKELEKVFVKPALGCLVHYEPPRPGYLKSEGEQVSLTTYWLRRIRMVDVVRCDPLRAEHSDASTRVKRTKKDEDSR